MPKRCSKCKSLNSSNALRCQNCNKEFSPESSGLPQPAAVAALAAAQDRVAELESEVHQRDEEVTNARAKIAQLEKDAAAQRSELERGGAQTMPAQPRLHPTTPAWMATALALLARWPKLTTAAAGIMALGTSYGGWTAYRGVPPPPATSQNEPVSTPPGSGGATPRPGGGGGSTPVTTPAGPSPPAVAPVGEIAAKDADRRKGLDKRESELNARESQLAARDGELGKRQAGLDNRESDLKAREDALLKQARLMPRAEAPLGFFDFVVPRQLLNDEITIHRTDIQGDFSTWPSKDCVVVAITPLDGKDRPGSIPGLCTPDRIMFKRPKGLDKGHSGRLTWQLKPK